MTKNEILKNLLDTKDELDLLKVKLDIETKEKQLLGLDALVTSDSFWDDIPKTKEVLSLQKRLRTEVNSFNDVYERTINSIEMCELELTDGEVIELETEYNKLLTIFEKLKVESLLCEEYDSSNAYVEIHSGAGGTESNDWANMLLRMYTRFFEKNDYSYEIISMQKGEEVGIKGVTLLVKGNYTYGYLKGETGVHRLVRISPFDSNQRRHTSFASVLVTPEVNKNVNIEISENDLKIDVYHSSGAGGQSVNTTDSAVRITHIPTGTVVSCQVERSQLKNKERAMEMLRQKLYMLSLKEFSDKLKSLKGDVMDVNFGSAVRSYVMCPYTLVKDTRTNAETSNIDKVLDGDIIDFLESYLKK